MLKASLGPIRNIKWLEGDLAGLRQTIAKEDVVIQLGGSRQIAIASGKAKEAVNSSTSSK